jgi:drug/metabolite transporter (DMT)-like permease
MAWLVLVSLIWAFSFGLIKDQLAGVDPSLVALMRITLALVVFLPVFRPRGLSGGDRLRLVGIGAVQFGLMYVFYISAFRFLKAYEVAVLTIFTPILVCLFEDLVARRFRWWPYAAAALATVGAGIVRPFTPGAAAGILLMQASNACFAFGQVAYRRWRIAHSDVRDARVFAWLYAGAAIAALPTAIPALGTVADLSHVQWETLLYLGVVASGLCFFLWNYGATRTAPGPLAVANNLKIPLAVAVALWVFHEQATPWRVAAGGSIVVLAGFLAEWDVRRRSRPA